MTGTLTTATGNELTVLGETEVRFCIGNMDCSWPVTIAQGPAHDFYFLVQIYFSMMDAKFTMTQEPLWWEMLKFLLDTAR